MKTLDRVMLDKFPRHMILGYIEKLKKDGVIQDSSYRSLQTTSWDDWDAGSLSQTILDLASQIGDASAPLLHVSEDDVCAQFMHPVTGEPMKGFFEVDSALVEMYSHELRTPKVSVSNDGYVEQAGVGMANRVALRGVSTNFNYITQHIDKIYRMGYLAHFCNKHEFHPFLVNIHRSTDWVLFESCYPLGTLKSSVGLKNPLVQEMFAGKISSLSTPQSKYSSTLFGESRHTYIGNSARLKEGDEDYEPLNEWGSLSYEEGYLLERSKFDSFFFFEILKTSCPDGAK